MSEIVEFLLARLAEDERIPKMFEARGWLDDDPGGPYEQGADGPYVEVSARRVLAEVEAKRRIVDAHPNVNDGDCETCVRPQWGYPTHGGSLPMPWPCPTLRLLVLPYADHPDYRQEWRP